MNTKLNTTLATSLASLTIGALCITSNAHAATILGTDFTGISINGSNASQADGVVWTGTGLSASTTLTLENVVTVQNDGFLMDSGDVSAVNGYFGGNTNLSSGNPSTGQWGVTIQLAVGSSAISLEDIGLNLRHATNSGSNQQNTRDTRVTINVIDTSDLSILGTASQTFNVIGNLSGAILDGQVTFASALDLAASGVYDIEFLVDSPQNNGGHYAAFGAISFNGEVSTIPEPSSTLLIALSGSALLLRRRR